MSVKNRIIESFVTLMLPGKLRRPHTCPYGKVGSTIPFTRSANFSDNRSANKLSVPSGKCGPWASTAPTGKIAILDCFILSPISKEFSYCICTTLHHLLFFKCETPFRVLDEKFILQHFSIKAFLISFLNEPWYPFPQNIFQS